VTPPPPGAIVGAHLLEQLPRGELMQDPLERDEGALGLEARAGRDLRAAAGLPRDRLQPGALEDPERQPVDELVVEVPGAEEGAVEEGTQRGGKRLLEPGGEGSRLGERDLGPGHVTSRSVAR
jgi:hypothetical protein